MTNNLAPHICKWCVNLNNRIQGETGICSLKRIKVPIEKFNNCKDWRFKV